MANQEQRYTPCGSLLAKVERGLYVICREKTDPTARSRSGWIAEGSAIPGELNVEAAESTHGFFSGEADRKSDQCDEGRCLREDQARASQLLSQWHLHHVGNIAPSALTLQPECRPFRKSD
jgi:hypothetical protein